MNPDKRLEAKLHSSLLPDVVEKETIAKLEWYRTELMKSQRKVRELEKQISDDGWRTNPDRMGGTFSDYETKDTGWH